MNNVNLGRIVSTVGFKGDLKCMLYSNELTCADKTVFLSMNDSVIEMQIKRYPYCGKKNMCVVVCTNPEMDVTSLIGKELWLPRDQLPELEQDEFYFHDIIGKPVFQNGREISRIKYVHDFGAGVVFELENKQYVHIKELEDLETCHIKPKSR